ncbi:MAG: RNA polymerase sigma factor [Planctomycetota bacterium]
MGADDTELIRRCQKAVGEEFNETFGELYRLFKDRVYSVAYRITGNPSDALDASQETFSILFRKIRDFRFQSKFSSWVYRIAVNASIDLCRRSTLRNTGSLDTIINNPQRPLEHAAFTPEDENAVRPRVAAEENEFSNDIQLAIQRLSPKLRTIIVLRYLENQSYEEVSEVLGCSLGTVKSRLARAHSALEPLLLRVCEKHYLNEKKP